MISQGARNAVLVYGASSSHIDPEYMEAARTLGELVARRGYPLISGGGRGGLMAAAIEGAHSEGGYTIGVLPQFMLDRDWQHPLLDEVVATDSMHSRKRTMAARSCCAIAMPGGIGTFEELMEIVTWRQLKLYSNPVVILNTSGYYNSLLEMLSKAASLGFMREGSGRLYEVASTPSEALDLALPRQ